MYVKASQQNDVLCLKMHLSQQLLFPSRYINVSACPMGMREHGDWWSQSRREGEIVLSHEDDLAPQSRISVFGRGL